jgi:hypothetical protein
LDNDTIKNIAFENVVLLQNEKELNTATKNTRITLLIQRKYATTLNKKMWCGVVKAPESSIRFLGFTRSCDTNGNCNRKIHQRIRITYQPQHAKEKVPKQWRSEGLTFNNNYSTLFTNVEEPLYEDSQCLNNKRRNDPFAFDAKAVKTSAGYLLDPIAHEPNPRTAFAVNGISAIQYYENNHLLIVERPTLLKQACTIKYIYVI